MARLTIEALWKLHQPTCAGEPSTPSQALEDGRKPCASPDARQMTLAFGRGRAHVPPSPSPVEGEASQTSATCGPSGSASFASADLQSSLASRLRALLHSRGSTLFSLTWKERVTPARRRICALRASVPRIDASDSGSWPTPMTRDFKDSGGMSLSGVNPDGSVRTRTDTLPRVASLTGWPTPTMTDSKSSARHGYENASHPGTTLLDAARLAVPGQTPSGSPVATGKRGQLNPALPRWLMGYRTAWDDCAGTATPSSRRSQQRSSPQHSTRSKELDDE